MIKQLDCVTKDEGKKLNAVRENVSVLRAKRWSQFFRFSVREVISSLRETFNVQSIRTVYVYLSQQHAVHICIHKYISRCIC